MKALTNAEASSVLFLFAGLVVALALKWIKSLTALELLEEHHPSPSRRTSPSLLVKQVCPLRQLELQPARLQARVPPLLYSGLESNLSKYPIVLCLNTVVRLRESAQFAKRCKALGGAAFHC